MWGRIREATTERIMSVCGFTGAVAVAVGYFIIARLPIDTVQIWDYGTSQSFANLAKLGLISLVLFASFISLGVVISVILGRAEERVGSLYARHGFATLPRRRVVRRLGGGAAES